VGLPHFVSGGMVPGAPRTSAPRTSHSMPDRPRPRSAPAEQDLHAALREAPPHARTKERCRGSEAFALAHLVPPEPQELRLELIRQEHENEGPSVDGPSSRIVARGLARDLELE
jgi:hypothetical protein